MYYFFIWKKKSLYPLQNKIHWLQKLFSKIELITFFFSIRIHVFKVNNFDMLKNEILNKLTKNAKFWCVKKKGITKYNEL